MLQHTFSVHSVLSDYVRGPVWEGYPESLDKNVFIHWFFYVKPYIVYDKKIVILNAFKCHIIKFKKKTNTKNVQVIITKKQEQRQFFTIIMPSLANYLA